MCWQDTFYCKQDQITSFCYTFCLKPWFYNSYIFLQPRKAIKKICGIIWILIPQAVGTCWCECCSPFWGTSWDSIFIFFFITIATNNTYGWIKKKSLFVNKIVKYYVVNYIFSLNTSHKQQHGCQLGSERVSVKTVQQDDDNDAAVGCAVYT